MGKTKIYCIGSIGNKLPKQKYDLRSVTRTTLEASGYTAVCDHCGKLLVNHASIRGMADNKDYTVGLDCMKRLLDAGTKFTDVDIYSWEYQRTEINNCLNLALKIEKELKDYEVKDCLVYFDVSKYRPGLEINWITPKGSSWQTEIPFRYKDIFKELIAKYSNKKKFEELYKKEHSEFVKSEYLTPGGGYYGIMLSLQEKRARLGLVNRKAKLYGKVLSYFQKLMPSASDDAIKAEVSLFLFHINDAIEIEQISDSCAKYLHKNDRARRLFQAITKVKIPLKLKNIYGLAVKDVKINNNLGTLGDADLNFVVVYEVGDETYFDLASAKKAYKSDRRKSFKSVMYGTEIKCPHTLKETEFDARQNLSKAEFNYINHDRRGIIRKKGEVFRLSFTKYTYLCKKESDSIQIIDMKQTDINELADIMTNLFKINDKTATIKDSMVFINWFKKRSIYMLKKLRDMIIKENPQTETDLCLIITKARREYEQRQLQGLED